LDYIEMQPIAKGELAQTGSLIQPATQTDTHTGTSAPTPTLIAGMLEQYGTSATGVALRWTAFAPTDAGTHPAVLVLHAGGFKAGDAGRTLSVGTWPQRDSSPYPRNIAWHRHISR